MTFSNSEHNLHRFLVEAKRLLCRNGNYELVAEWPAFFCSGVYRSHVEKDLSSLRFPQDDKGSLEVTSFTIVRKRPTKRGRKNYSEGVVKF